MIARPTLRNEAGTADLKLEEALREWLRKDMEGVCKEKGITPLPIYSDAEKVPGALKLRGSYRIKEQSERIFVTFQLMLDSAKMLEVKIPGTKDDLPELVQLIGESMLDSVKDVKMRGSGDVEISRPKPCSTSTALTTRY